MGRAIDLFVTYRFLKLLTTPFKKTDAYKLGIINDKGHRILKKNSDKPEVELNSSQQQGAYTILHKLVFNIKKLFNKVPGLRSKVGTYAAALFLLKDTFKESVDDPDMFEREFIKFLKENKIEFDNEISEEVIGFGEVLPKGNYVLVNDILNKEDEEISATKGDLVMTFEDQSPVDTILGVDIFPVIHIASNEKIFVSLEDIKEE
jgi:hypothetical protein|tara:strand:- start:1477 stop:2091 length:615 start_codon:yes stop_codon:yes gene_type:complete